MTDQDPPLSKPSPAASAGTSGRDSGALLSDDGLRLVAALIPQPAWVASADGSTWHTNDLALEYTGRQGTASPVWDWNSLVHPDDAQAVRLAWEESIRTEVPFHSDHRLRRFDGSFRWHACRARPVRDELGTVCGWILTATDIDAAKAGEGELRAAHRKTAEALTLLETLQAEAPVGFAFIDLDFRTVRCNETLAALTGSTAADLIGYQVPDLIPELWPLVEPIYAQVRDKCEAVRDIEIEGPSPRYAGEVGHWLLSCYPILIGGETIGIGIVVVDISERKKAERLHAGLAALVEGSGDAIVGSSLDGIVTSWNRSAERLFGYTADEIIGQPLAVLVQPEVVAGMSRLLARLAAGGPHEQREIVGVRQDGSLVDVLVTASAAIGDGGRIVAVSVIAHDISERKQLEQTIAHQALHDPLTGLPNRYLLADRLLQGLAGSQRRGSRVGVIFVDVDDFKAINDAFGHSGGDEVLRSVAGRIDSAVRPGDTVARFGGDEFVVVCDDVTIVEIEQVARRVFDAVCAPRIVDDEDRSITASLGVALADDAATPDSLLHDSDAAMYRAKALGRARIEVSDDRDRDQGLRRPRTVPVATGERNDPGFDRRSTTHKRTE